MSTEDQARAADHASPAADSPQPAGPYPDREHARLPYGQLGRRLSRSSPFYVGFVGGLGVILAWYLSQAIFSARQVLVLIVVSMFLAVGLSPMVDALVRRGLRRGLSVAAVGLGLLLVFGGFVAAIAPPVTEQTTEFVQNAPLYLDQLQSNRTIQRLDADYQIIEQAKDYITSGTLGQQVFGGLFGVGKFVLGTLFSAVTVLILTLYFLGSLPAIKRNAYLLAPRTRRERVRLLSDEILQKIGGFVGGALLVAISAGVVTFVFLETLGLQYALALALLVAMFDLIPMIGATIGAVIVIALAFIDSAPRGVACVIFFLLYQQFENYMVYPRVMKRSVDVPPAATVVAALVGGTLLGVVGALLAIPLAAAVLLLIREVVLPRQETA
ncbi:MAG: AI-2E family transporter [Carbonactinosporaceae bacterium]